MRTGHYDVIFADAGTGEGEGRSLGLFVRQDRRAFDVDRDVTAILEFAAMTGAQWRAKKKVVDGFALRAVNRTPSGSGRKTWNIAP